MLINEISFNSYSQEQLGSLGTYEFIYEFIIFVEFIYELLDCNEIIYECMNEFVYV